MANACDTLGPQRRRVLHIVWHHNTLTARGALPADAHPMCLARKKKISETSCGRLQTAPAFWRTSCVAVTPASRRLRRAISVPRLLSFRPPPGGPSLAESEPDFPDVGPHVAESKPMPHELVPKSAKVGQNLAQSGSLFANTGPMLAKSGPILVDVGRLQSKFGRIRGMVSPIRANVSRFQANCGRNWPMSGQMRSNSSKVSPFRHKSGQKRPGCGHIRAVSVGLSPSWAKLGRQAGAGRNSAGLGPRSGALIGQHSVRKLLYVAFLGGATNAHTI